MTSEGARLASASPSLVRTIPKTQRFPGYCGLHPLPGQAEGCLTPPASPASGVAVTAAPHLTATQARTAGRPGRSEAAAAAQPHTQVLPRRPEALGAGWERSCSALRQCPELRTRGQRNPPPHRLPSCAAAADADRTPAARPRRRPPIRPGPASQRRRLRPPDGGCCSGPPQLAGGGGGAGRGGRARSGGARPIRRRRCISYISGRSGPGRRAASAGAGGVRGPRGGTLARGRARPLVPRLRDRTMAAAAARRPSALLGLVAAALLFPAAAGECPRVGGKEAGEGADGGAPGEGAGERQGAAGPRRFLSTTWRRGRLGRSRLPPPTPAVSEPGGARGLLVPLLAERGGGFARGAAARGRHGAAGRGGAAAVPAGGAALEGRPGSPRRLALMPALRRCLPGPCGVAPRVVSARGNVPAPLSALPRYAVAGPGPSFPMRVPVAAARQGNLTIGGGAPLSLPPSPWAEWPVRTPRTPRRVPARARVGTEPGQSCRAVRARCGPRRSARSASGEESLAAPAGVDKC